MEKMQQRSETEPESIRNKEINSRTNLQFNRSGVGSNYARKKRENLSNRSPTSDESTEVGDEDLEDDDDAPSPPRRSAVCGLCHLPPAVAGVAGVSTGPGPMFSCAHGHLLCQQCVKRYTVCSEIGCAVCGGDLYSSTSNCYRVTSRANSDPPNVESACGDPRSGARMLSYTTGMRSLVPGQESQERPRSSGSRDFNETIINGANFFGGNSRFTADCSSGWDGDAGDSGIPPTQRANANSLRMQQLQYRNHCGGSRSDDADLEIQSLQRNSARDYQGNGNAALVQAECSRRPIRCPRLDCAVNVAFSALTHHFLFDHPEVPILSVEPGTRSTLVVSFAALSCDSSRCLALLLVSGKLTGVAARLFNGSQIQPRYRNRLPLPVLAARLHCSSQNSREEDRAYGDGQGQGDVVIAWVAGLDVGCSTSGTALRCSIQAVDGNDNGGLRSLTYTGPVNSLRTAQRPREVFKTGDCVILHQGLIDHISSGCTSFNVNVIVH